MTTVARLDGIKRSAVPAAKQDKEPAMSTRSAALLALVAAAPAQLGLAARGPTHGWCAAGINLWILRRRDKFVMLAI